MSFSVEATVRGCHTYKDTWAAVVGEELPCQREVGNRVNTFTVAAGLTETDRDPLGAGRTSTIDLEIAIEGHLGVANQTAPRVKILAYRKFTGSKFRSSYFRETSLGTKSAKICTMRKFPAVRYYCNTYVPHLGDICKCV